MCNGGKTGAADSTPRKERGTAKPEHCGSPVADAECIGLRENGDQSARDPKRNDPAHWKKRRTELCEAGCGSSTFSDPKSQRRDRGEQIAKSEGRPGPPNGLWWDAEPDVGRVAHGVPHRVDRLRCLGNAVVPQQFYPIFKAIADVWQ